MNHRINAVCNCLFPQNRSLHLIVHHNETTHVVNTLLLLGLKHTQLEEAKAQEIRQLKMQLFQDLNAALREKELQALRFQLDKLRIMVQEKLAWQASLDEVKANAKANQLQDLRIQLNEIMQELERRNKNSSSSDDDEKTTVNWWKSENIIASAKKILQPNNNNNNNSKNGVTQSNSGTTATQKTPKPFSAKSQTKKASEDPPKQKIGVVYGRPPRVTQKEPAKRNGAEVKSKSTIKLGPFTPRQDDW